MNRKWRIPLLVGLTAMGLASLLGWAATEYFRDPLANLDQWNEENPSPATPTIKSISSEERFHKGYLGSQSCAECHSAICEMYSTHPMGRSMSLAKDAPDSEAYTKSKPFLAPLALDFDFRISFDVTLEGAKVVHNERAVDSAGNEICGRSVEAHYAVGSGQRGHSYLHDAGGQLYMSPITWYAGAQSFDISPSYDKYNLHFERRILDGCVACHVGRTAADSSAAHTYDSERPFVEFSIGCERCHGPGEAHVAFHHGQAKTAGGKDPIVNPAKLAQPYRDDVCFQCHLTGIKRVVHPDQRDFDFRPGQALADVWTVFMDGTKISENSTTKAVGQSEQMLASRCYNESQGAMSCTSCHDPHSLPSEANRIDFYRSKCLHCHGEGHDTACLLIPEERLKASPEDSCIQCHMPRLAANNVPHTAQTDHRVLRKPSDGLEKSAPPEIAAYESSRLSPEIVDRAKGIFFIRQAEDSGDKTLANRAIPHLSSWTRNNPFDCEALSALGTAYSLSQDLVQALPTLEQALKVDPKDEYTLRELAYLHHDMGNIEDAIRYGKRLIEVNPHQFEYHGRMAHMLGQAKRMEEAIASGKRAEELQPWDFQIQGWLAEAYRLTGQSKLAEKHQKLYEKLRPRNLR